MASITVNKGVTGSPVFIEDRTIEIKPFYICDHEVTQHEYESIMGKNPSYFNSDPAPGEVQGNRPVGSVCWYAALVYCNKRSIKEGFTPCYSINNKTNPSEWGEVPTESDKTWNAVECNFEADGYRLPTEVEWEYAARGGNLEDTQTPNYSGSGNIDEVAWYKENSGGKTHEVKKKNPNALGLYDMSGNALEWCWDWYDKINTNTPFDGPESGFKDSRVGRGGPYNYDADHCTSVWREYSGLPWKGGGGIGFRVVRSIRQ